ncbi:MAG: NADH-quinone oxidoreductase subunit M [Anaerolineales bacterium]|jgi:NADH-quinone oxidoreductase subunit M
MNVLLHPLTLVVFFPLVGVVLLLFLKEEQRKEQGWIAFLTSLVTFGLSLWVLARFQLGNPDLQLELRVPWIQIGGIWNMEFHLGVDGISLLLLLLTTLLSTVAILSSWGTVRERSREFYIVFLLLEIGMTGVFLALDLFLFYIFWEFTLVPMYLLIGIWGGPRKIYAALKFFLYTMAGSVLMFLAIIWLGMSGGTFSLPDLIARGQIPSSAQTFLFLAFGLAFAIKVPVWPLHSWLPDAHVEAPTAGSVLLAGILLKMGTYGFLRFNLTLFPQASIRFAPLISVLAVIGILYGAAVSYAQKDWKKLVAFSSVSHLGFIMLGIFALNPEGIQGALLQMVNHGISTGALFLIVGMIYERRHTRELAALGGIWRRMPIYGGLALVVSLSSMGLPGLNGFVGEFTILLGAFGSRVLGSPLYAVFGVVGVVLSAIYILLMFERVFLGTSRDPKNQSLRDLSVRELFTLAPLVLLMFWIGLYPKPFFALMAPSLMKVISGLQSAVVAVR